MRTKSHPATRFVRKSRADDLGLQFFLRTKSYPAIRFVRRSSADDLGLQFSVRTKSYPTAHFVRKSSDSDTMPASSPLARKSRPPCMIDARITQSYNYNMKDIIFWLFIAAGFIAGIVLMVRGFALYKDPSRSKMRFFLSCLATLAPRETILIFIIWNLSFSYMRFIVIYIVFFEILLLLGFIFSFLGSKKPSDFRYRAKNFSIFFLSHLLVLTLYVGPSTWISGSSIMEYVQWSDGFQYSERSGGIAILQYQGDETDIVVPSAINDKPVTEIAKGALGFDSRTTSITIPDGVTNIGESAFAKCTSLTSISIPGSVIVIDGNPFKGCSSLTSIDVSPDNAHFVSVDGILYSKNMDRVIACPGGKTGDVQIPDSVKHLGDSCFEDCSNLTGIALPDKAESIGSQAFYGCYSLREFTMSNSMKSIGESAFFCCWSLEEIQIPAGVTTIGRHAFSGCDKMTAITVSPENLNFSSDSGILYDKEQTVLLHCPSGKSGDVTVLPGVTTIGDFAFRGCERITSVTLPDSVTTLGIQAFYGCKGITSLVLPDGVTEIRSWAFIGCNLTSITIPDSVTSIDRDAFKTNNNTPNVVIYCSENSHAHTYAKDNDITYVLIE